MLRCSYHGGSTWAGSVEVVIRAVGKGRRVESGFWEDSVVVVVGEDIMAAPAQASKSRMRGIENHGITLYQGTDGVSTKIKRVVLLGQDYLHEPRVLGAGRGRLSLVSVAFRALLRRAALDARGGFRRTPAH